MIRMANRIGTAGMATLVGALLACANGSENDAAPALVPVAAQEGTVTLSAAEPRAVLPVTVDLQDVNVLGFAVANVRNTEGSAIRIAAHLEDATRNVPLGSVALFPVDQGGTFALRVPTEARDLVAGTPPAGVGLVLTLTAEPAPPAGETEPSVRIDQIRWSYQPR